MNECPQCKSPTTQYPGGVSKKSGKPYNARTSCDNSECSYVLWEKDSPKTPQKASGAPNNPLQDEILDRLAKRLDGMDSKLDSIGQSVDNIVAYFIDSKKDQLREKSWKPTTSSPKSETPSQEEGSFPQENG